MNSCTCLFCSRTHSTCKHMYIMARRLRFNVREIATVEATSRHATSQPRQTVQGPPDAAPTTAMVDLPTLKNSIATNPLSMHLREPRANSASPPDKINPEAAYHSSSHLRLCESEGNGNPLGDSSVSPAQVLNHVPGSAGTLPPITIFDRRLVEKQSNGASFQATTSSDADSSLSAVGRLCKMEGS